MKKLKVTLITLVSFVIVLLVTVRILNFYPDDLEEKEVTCTKVAPLLKKGQKLKVLSWNVQFMAGKSYVFFYEKTEEKETDIRPSAKEIVKTTKRVAEVIKEEDPDIVLLQEIDEGAGRTDHENQREKLFKELPANQYACFAEAFYWKSKFVPHPKILGSAGMKALTLSKYKITKAFRHSLPDVPKNRFFAQFSLKRAILETHLPYEDDPKSYFNVMNTHYSAFSQGTGTMALQTNKTAQLLDKEIKNGVSWLIGGDFNLLPSKEQFEYTKKRWGRPKYNPETELKPFFEKYKAVPSLKEASGKNMKKWFTHIPNTRVKPHELDRTIDYIFFHKDIKINQHYIRSKDTQDISDHLPVVASIQIPK